MQNKTVQSLLNWGTDFLQMAHVENAKLESEILLRFMLKLDRVALLTQLAEPVDETTFNSFRHLIRLRCEHVPLQYLTGEQEFMGLPFKITPAVLIPRGDTEVAVETVCSLGQKLAAARIADIGTGSGAIAVSVAHLLSESQVWATEIDHRALEVATYNAELNGVAERVIFCNGDLCEPLEDADLIGKLDIIVSNPPYIPTAEIPFLQPEVLREPALALDGGDDGLDIYRRLIPASRNYLQNGGYIVLEIGADQGADVSTLLQENGFHDVEVKQDYGNRDRVVVGRK